MRAFGKKHSMNGGIEAINVSQPVVGDGEILVKMMAIGVGVHDEYFHAPGVEYPYVIGIEGAGVVESVGRGVNDYKSGDRITFISMMQPKGGTWAQYAVVSSQSLILPIPDNMSFEQAAAIPVAANTALKALTGANLQSGDSLFVAGGAGAIGTLLIQLAKARGITIVASASSKNHDYMKKLGADATVDYHDNSWQDQVRDFVPGGVDAAIAIHPGTPLESQRVIKDGGILIAVSGDQLTTERGIILRGIFNNIDVKSELLNFIDDVVKGEVKLTLDKKYSFNEALSALEQVKTRHSRGKIVLTI